MGDRLGLEIGLMTGKLAQVKCLEQIVRSQIAPRAFCESKNWNASEISCSTKQTT